MHNAQCTIIPYGQSDERKGVGEIRGFRVKPFLKKGLQGYGDRSPPIVTDVLAYGANKNKGGEIQSDRTDRLRCFLVLSGVKY